MKSPIGNVAVRFIDTQPELPIAFGYQECANENTASYRVCARDCKLYVRVAVVATITFSLNFYAGHDAAGMKN